MNETEITELFQNLIFERQVELQLDIGRRPTAYMEYDRIYVSREVLKEQKAWVEGWLLHEIEHRASIPGSLERQLLWEYIALDEGVPRPARLVHFFSDMLIDRKILSRTPTRYMRYLQNRDLTLRYLTDDLRKVYCQILDLYGNEQAEVGRKTHEAYQAMFSGAIELETRLRKLSRILRTDFVEAADSSPDLTSPIGLSFQQRDRLIRSLLYTGATPARVEDFFNKIHARMSQAEKRQILAATRKLYLYNLLQTISPILRAFRTADYPVMEIWNPGDHPSELSIVDTYRIYGILVPGVFAIKRRELVSGKRAKSVSILMDCSASTGLSMSIGREREAAFGLVEAAKELNDMVSFVPFSTNVLYDDTVFFSKDYEGIQDAVVRVEPSGYTNVTPPLSLALKAAEMAGRQTTFIMTDGGMWDSEQALGMLNRLTEFGKVVFFIFGAGVSGMQKEAKEFIRGVNVYECDPKEPIMEEALKEYLG